MVPPWVPEPEPDTPAEAPSEPTPPEESPAPEPPSAPAPHAPVPLAPSGRFTGTRRALGGFAKTADKGAMRVGVARYVRSGYGGSATAARRFGGTAQTAGVLYGALSPAGRAGAALPGGALDAVVLVGRSASEIMNAVVEAVRPLDGTLDGEASRVAIKDALSELLTRYPDAALLDLTEEQRLFAVERYVAGDVYRRFQLDVGKTIQDKAPTARAALARLKEVRDYVRETVSAAFRKFVTGSTLTARQLARVVQSSLKEAFGVFESYLQ